MQPLPVSGPRIPETAESLARVSDFLAAVERFASLILFSCRICELVLLAQFSTFHPGLFYWADWLSQG